jgi:hypothetical protein
MSVQSLMVSKYHKLTLKMSRSRPVWFIAQRRDPPAQRISGTTPPALILRMVRGSPKVQLVALVDGGLPDA